MKFSYCKWELVSIGIAFLISVSFLVFMELNGANLNSIFTSIQLFILLSLFPLWRIINKRYGKFKVDDNHEAEEATKESEVNPEEISMEDI